jgi:hypothetical protein
MGAERACPGEETLVRFLAGGAAEGERDGIARHVDACSACALILALPGSAATGAVRGAAAPPVLAGSLRSGSVLAGRYRIQRPLGAGGMGEVYEAFDLSLNETVALKTVRATISDNPRAVELLKSEVQLARRVTHPNVCRIFDFGVDEGTGAAREPTPFLTMELLRGTTLARALQQGTSFARDDILALARQIAAGLAAAHRVGVIHKDLKSENVMLTSSPEGQTNALVTDFGLAATHSVLESEARPAARFSGTPGYVAPERLTGAPATEASDVFALGVVLADLATGTLPSRRTRDGLSPPARDPLAALAARCQAAAPSARPRLPEVLETLRRLESPGLGRRRRALTWSAAVAVAAAAAVLTGMVALRDRQPAPPPAQAAVAAPSPPLPPLAAAAIAAPPAEAAPRHLSRSGHAPRAAPVRAPARSTTVAPIAGGDQPIRSLGQTARTAPRDDAPIDPFSHAQ